MVSSSRSKLAYLEQYADPGFVPPDNWDSDAITRVEARRVRKNALVACVAAETPRRLGNEAEGFELAGDRYLSKGIGHTYFTLWRRLTTAKHAPLPLQDLDEEEMSMFAPPDDWKSLAKHAHSDEDARRLGKTILWDAWWKELRPRLLARRRAIATYAVRQSDTSWGYRICSGIASELDWIEIKFENYQLRYLFPFEESA